MQRARASLDRAENRIGLSAAELTRLDRAKRKLLAGDAGPLEALDSELAAATGTYTVHGGGSLADVAARPEVYGNASLWPLIWHANRDQPRPPALLSPGARLSFPVHPTAEEAAAAINEAGGGGATGSTSAAPAWP